jgi:hypothetical protein
MKIQIIALIIAFLILPSSGISKDKNVIPDVKRINYSWASERVHKPFWGISVADLNGDGTKHTLLLERSRLSIGTFQGKKYVEAISCEWPGDSKGAKLDVFDFDNDGDAEAFITGVDDGVPSSIILDYEGGECKTVMKDIRWSLRKTDLFSPKGQVLVGQWWNSHDYFAGPVYEMKIGKKKLKKGKRVPLPWRSKLYQFTLLHNVGDSLSVVLQKGFASLQLRERVGKKFKKIWQSPRRFGGSINLLPADTRRVLGEEKSGYVTFDVPPTVINTPSGLRMLAVHQDMPLKGFVGRRPYIRSSDIVIFNEDPALGFIEDTRTVMLPGAVADYAIDNTGENGAKRLFVLVLEGVEFFEKDASSAVFAFDIAGSNIAVPTAESAMKK